MRPSDSNSQVRADHYSAMGHMGNGGGGGGGGDDGTANFNKTHTAMPDPNSYPSPTKIFTDTDDLAGSQPEFLQTMSPQVRTKHDHFVDMNTDTHADSNAFTNPTTNYHSHAKIGRNGKKKGSVEHMGSTPHQMSAVIPDQYNLPKVKDAKTSKKTF